MKTLSAKGSDVEKASDAERSPTMQDVSVLQHEEIVACGESPPDVPILASFWDVQLPALYWLDMAYEGSAWAPAIAIPMPYHHATRLELTNVGDFPALADHSNTKVRFTLELLSRDIRPSANQREWRTTYKARIVSVCIPVS